MKTICIDPGHRNNDRDRGGQSLGVPESDLVLPYALEVAAELRRIGHHVILTRTDDRPVLLSARSKIANDAGADLFVSIHANASDNPRARGPWTIHAAGSERGRRIARQVQSALARVAGGHPDRVYPDASSWVGNRRLSVLRQTQMPAILIELGFMTNPADIQQMQSPDWRRRASLAIAHAVSAAVAPGETIPPLPVAVPKPAPDQPVVVKEVIPSVVPPPLLHPEMALQPIRVPTLEHIEQAATAAQLRPEWLQYTVPPFLAILHAIAKGNEGPRGALAAEMIGALEAYRRKHCPS